MNKYHLLFAYKGFIKAFVVECYPYQLPTSAFDLATLVLVNPSSDIFYKDRFNLLGLRGNDSLKDLTEFVEDYRKAMTEAFRKVKI